MITIDEFRKELRTKINDVRIAEHYVKRPKKSDSRYLNGYRVGVYDGLEMALGILESIEYNNNLEDMTL